MMKARADSLSKAILGDTVTGTEKKNLDKYWNVLNTVETAGLHEVLELKLICCRHLMGKYTHRVISVLVAS
jgi:hypothetical protein